MPEAGHPVNYINALKTALINSTASGTTRLQGPLRQQTTVPMGEDDDFHREARRERAARWRVLARSFLGVALLFIAQWLQSYRGAPFTGPHGWSTWLAAVCGIVGIWLVPGVWLSTLMMRTGTDLVAGLATRIGVPLVWYGLVGIVVHYSAQGADPTAWSIIGVTTAATAATCLGVALGILPRPVERRTRILVSGAVGGACAQAVIWLAMGYWTYQINYQHIRRLDWLIVLACALLAALGQANRPTLPVRDAAQIQRALTALTTMTAIAAITIAAAVTWPTTQHLPPELAAEQIFNPAGADIAFALAGTGPNGSDVLRSASFAAIDDLGRPVPTRFHITNEGGAKDRATLLVMLDPTARPALCGPYGPSAHTLPVKVTVRDQYSGLSTQATLPAGWCAR
jgi:hypothetical protein